MAGFGKTSIAKTVCAQASADTEIRLGGSFFCSRSTGVAAQRDIRCVIPTITRLLARNSTDFRLALAATIDDDIQHKEVSAQIELLLRTPLATLKDTEAPILFVIDALDECGGETADGALDDTKCHAVVTDMLEALVGLTQSEPQLPIKFLVTSRPETQIRDTSISNKKLSQILRLHTVDATEVNADIRRYISQTLDTKLSSQPKLRACITDSDIEDLVQLCDGLFIVAAVAIAHTFGVGTDAAVSKFKKLLNSAQNGLHDRAAVPLDRMYEIIINAAAGEGELDATELPALQRILASLLSARMTLSVTALADLLDMETYDVRASLSQLHAVVYVPEDNDMPGLRTVHASFGDYLYSRAPNHIRIPKSFGHEVLAQGCLDLMAKHLRFNVSQSRSSYDPNMPERPGNITLSLEYACMQWVYHISALADTGNLHTKIGMIFRPRLLPWLEVMSVLRQVWRATRILFAAAATVSTQSNSGLAQFLHDAHLFVASSHEAIERSAPHIYISALPFADKDSLVYKDFATRCAGLINVDRFAIGNHGEHGGNTVMTLTGHSGPVLSVAYSGDGRLLVSGSKDRSVRIWDTRTGEEARAPFLSGNSSVLTVDFAQNNQWVASGTESGLVCVWSVTLDRASHRQLKGHSDRVNCVKFSPDGFRLASASFDKTLCLWNPGTGQKFATLLGHTGHVIRVAFFPDGEVLASGSSDKTIRMWHSNTEQVNREPLTNDSGHSIHISPDGKIIAGTAKDGIVLLKCKTGDKIAFLEQETTRCIQFSPDGRLMVAVCGNATRLWTLQPDPQHASWVDLWGHRGDVNWATFSPDGLYIASASDDATIRIWSVGSGQSAVKTLPVHEHPVKSVAVSHDGGIIVSTSDDEPMRVWNTCTGAAIIPSFSGHKSLVFSVSISSDGHLIASASMDYTIQLWDTQSGAAIGEPMCNHSDWVRAVTFSNNDRWLASASDDRTVRVWDVATRQLLAIGPLCCQSWVYTVAFSPDDGLVTAGDRRGRIYLWQTDTGEQMHKPFYANDSSVLSVAFSPDGTRIVSGGLDNAARIWNIATGQYILVLQGHTNSIQSVAWSLNACTIGTGSTDTTLRLWDAMTGAPLATVRGHTKTVNSVAFTRNGQFIVSASEDATVRKWDVCATCRSSESGTDPITALESATLEDGWLVGSSGNLILWVPADYRVHLAVYPCVLRIHQSCVAIGVGDTGLHAGLDWTSCWRG